MDGETYLYDPFHYLVLSSHLHFQAEYSKASPSLPFLSFVLQIEPALVRRVSSDMLERRTTAFRSRRVRRRPRRARRWCPRSTRNCSGRCSGSSARWAGTPTGGSGSPVPAGDGLPGAAAGQFARLLSIAAVQAATNPVSAVLDYVRAHLSEPLTVADMAEQVSLSPSAFAHLFRDVTGRSPYQFLKEMRLDQARELLSTEPGRGPGLQGGRLRQRLALHQRVPRPVRRHSPGLLRHERHARRDWAASGSPKTAPGPELPPVSPSPFTCRNARASPESPGTTPEPRPDAGAMIAVSEGSRQGQRRSSIPASAIAHRAGKGSLTDFVKELPPTNRGRSEGWRLPYPCCPRGDTRCWKAGDSTQFPLVVLALDFFYARSGKSAVPAHPTIKGDDPANGPGSGFV